MFSTKTASGEIHGEGLRRRQGSTKVELVKSSGAQFQGSFAAGARHEQWTQHSESAIGRKALRYTLSGWSNKSIWKAAVGPSDIDQLQAFWPTILLTSMEAYRVYGYFVSNLHRRHDKCNCT